MLEFEKQVLTFKSPSGKVHEMDIPAYSVVKKVQAKVESNLEESDKIIEKALVEWGCSKEIYDEFNLSQIGELWSALLNGKKK